MSFADVKPRAPGAKRGLAPPKRGPAPPMTPRGAASSSLSANDLALEEEERAKAAAPSGGEAPMVVNMSERGQAARQDEAHTRFLNQYTADATEVASIFTELGSHLEQQQESLDKVEDNTHKAVEELGKGIEEYAGGAIEKAKGDRWTHTMVAGAGGVGLGLAAIATGGLALGVAAGAVAIAGGVGAQAEFKLVEDAAQGEVDAVKIQQALGSLKDQKDWSPDASSTECEGCHAVFDMWCRRHHCRKCGGVFCSTCAPKQASTPQSPPQLHFQDCF